MVGGVWVGSQRGSALGSNSRAGGPLSKCLSCGSFRTTPSSPAAPMALGKAQSSLLRGELPPGCPCRTLSWHQSPATCLPTMSTAQPQELWVPCSACGLEPGKMPRVGANR